MAIGDAALAAGMDLVSGAALANTLDTEDNKTRDYIAAERAARIAADAGKYDKPAGGAALARIEPGSAHSIGFYTDGASTLYFRPVASTAMYDRKITTQAELDAAIAAIPAPAVPDLSSRVAKAGDTMSGHLFLPASSAATSSYTVAYINGDGRVSRGASSIRYKDLLADPDVNTLGNIFPTLRQFAMKGDETGKPTLGYIAEELAENPATNRFVVRYGDPEQIESIDFVQLLIAQVANLNVRLAALETQN